MTEKKPKQMLEKLQHIHECMINALLMDPARSNQSLAAEFHYTATWVSKIINSDSFQARLAERRKELLDPEIKATVEDRMKAVTLQAVDQIRRELDSKDNASLALQSLNVMQSSLGILNGQPIQNKKKR